MEKNRNKYIKKGIQDIDKNISLKEIDRVNTLKRELQFEKNQYKRLARLEAEAAAIYGRKQRSSRELRRISKSLNLFKREESRLISETERRDLRDLREAFLEAILVSKKDVEGKNESDEIAKRLRRITGKVAENRMRRMVSWKLSWWFSGFGEKLFTFTGGEKEMRRHAALMTILVARDAGWLGSDEEEKPYSLIDPKTGEVKIIHIESNLLSEKARNMARNSIFNTMFGMSMVHLSESAAGAGAQLMLYKAYPWQQMFHDWRILKSWYHGSDNWMERISRLNQAAVLLGRRSIESYMFGDPKKREYNPTESGLDHEAIKVLRFLISRVAMTSFSILVEMMPFIRGLFRSPIMREFSSMMRGGENPAVRIAFRMLVNLAIFASLDADQWEGNVVEIGWDLARLFFPVFLTFPFYTIYRIV